MSDAGSESNKVRRQTNSSAKRYSWPPLAGSETAFIVKSRGAIGARDYITPLTQRHANHSFMHTVARFCYS